MANLPNQVKSILSRFGQPCTVTKRATPSNPNPPTTRTFIRISEKNAYSFGQVQTVTQGLMPATNIDLQGATITLKNGRSYNVVSVDSKVTDGTTFMQKVTLGNG